MARLDPPTEDEVLAALEKETVYGTAGTGWRAANRIDVAERIARSRGWNGIEGTERARSGAQPTRAVAIGKWVNVKAVQEVLEKLRSQDKAYAFLGGHPFIAGKYGITPGHVYYLSQEALDRAIEGQRKSWLERAEVDALAAAKELVLQEHAEDVEKHRRSFLAAVLPTEPNWQDIVNNKEGN